MSAGDVVEQRVVLEDLDGGVPSLVGDIFTMISPTEVRERLFLGALHVDDTEFGDYWEVRPKEAWFLDANVASAAWQAILGRSSPYFLIDDTVSLLGPCENIGSWLDTQDRVVSREILISILVGSLALEKENFDTLFLAKPSTIILSSWRYMLEAAADFLAFEDDCSMIFPIQQFPKFLLQFTALGEVRRCSWKGHSSPWSFLT